MLSTDAFVWTCCVKILGKTKNIIVSGIIVELKRRRGGVYSFHFFEKSFDKKKLVFSAGASLIRSPASEYCQIDLQTKPPHGCQKAVLNYLTAFHLSSHGLHCPLPALYG